MSATVSGLTALPRQSQIKQSRSWARFSQAVFLLIEIGVWLGIGATASRGAAVAALGAAVIWALSWMWLDRAKRQKIGIWFGLRIGMCILGLAVFSFGGRVAPGFLAQDKSIGNRFVLWRGASELIAASPWTGWGVGETGNAFMQWVQPIDRTESYKTMVNSFLHVGVERGLPALALLLALTFAGISWPFAFGRSLKSDPMKAVVRGASAVLFSWASSNIFSTLFQDWRLWVLPAFAVISLLVSLAYIRIAASFVLRWIGLTVGIAGFLVVGIYLFGKNANSENVIQLSHPEKEVVILARGKQEANACWGLLVDKNIMGKLYGHELRRWGTESGDPWRVAIFDARTHWANSKVAVRTDRWILFGETALEANSLNSDNLVVFVHPRGRLPLRWSGRGAVIFNGVDEDGSREQWMQWATRQKLRVVTVAAVGLDARAEWPLTYMRSFDAVQ